MSKLKSLKSKENGISLKQHIKEMKKKRPDTFNGLKNPTESLLVPFNLKRMMFQKKMSINKLAEVSGLSLILVKRILWQPSPTVTASYDPKLSELETLAKALGVKVTSFFKYRDLTK